MGVNKHQRPAWFKLWLRYRPQIEAVPDDVVGKALKAALLYFSTGELIQLTPLEAVIFSAFKADVDEANDDYQRDVENGKKGGRPKKDEQEKPPVGEDDPSDPTPAQVEVEVDVDVDVDVEVEVDVEEEVDVEVDVDVEEEVEVDKEKDIEVDKEKEREGERKITGADKPPQRPRFSPPTNDEVLAYCRQQGYTFDISHFTDYYESNGWMVGKNKMKDWKAAVRNWNRKENEKNGHSRNHASAGSEPLWPSIGTTL